MNDRNIPVFYQDMLETDALVCWVLLPTVISAVTSQKIDLLNCNRPNRVRVSNRRPICPTTGGYITLLNGQKKTRSRVDNS